MKRLRSRHVTVLDQIVSSASNFSLVALAAHVSTTADFGRFSLAYVVLIFFLGLERALIGEVLLVRFSGDAVEERTFGAAAGLGVILGVLAALGLVLGGLIVTPAAAIWFTLALATPVVVVQDVLRYVLICRRQSSAALVVDTVWLGVGVALMLLAAQQDLSVVWVVGAWALGAALSAGVGLIVARTVPRPGAGVDWVRSNRTLAVRFSAEYASLNASTALVWFALAVPVGASGVAALRGASLLFSPLNTAFNAVRIAMIPELVRRWSTPSYRRALAETTLILLTLALGWGLAVLLLPDRWGELVLGDTWVSAEPLRLANFLQATAMVVYTVTLSFYRSAALHTHSSLMRGVLAILTLTVPLGGAVLLGTAGAAWGFAVAVALSVLIGLVRTHWSRRSHPPEMAA